MLNDRVITRCGLLDQIPSSLLTIASLETLDLSFNYLDGFIPRGLASMPKLNALKLSYNQFSGSIPTELFGIRSRLQILQVDHNSLTGTLFFYKPWIRLVVFDISFNDFVGAVPLKIMLMPGL